MIRTFKETTRRLVWLFSSVGQIDRFCTDFVQFHNRDRPHRSWGGRTPDEVYSGRPQRLGHLGRVAYFDSRLTWWRFG